MIPILKVFENEWGLLFFVELMIGRHRCFNGIMIEQLLRHLGIFGGNKMYITQDLHSPKRQIFDVSYWRADEIEYARHDVILLCKPTVMVQRGEREVY